MKKIDVWLTILSVLFVINLILLVVAWLNASVLLQPVQTQSEVTVGSFYSVNDRFPSGIVFDPVTQTPLTDNPAQDNDGGASGETLYGIDVIDASVDVEFCVRANRALTDDSSNLTLGSLSDETYASSKVNNLGSPGPSGTSTPFTTSDVLMSGAGAVSSGETAWMRFWIDVPQDVQSGTYTNTVIFTAQEAGSGDVC